MGYTRSSTQSLSRQLSNIFLVLTHTASRMLAEPLNRPRHYLVGHRYTSYCTGLKNTSVQSMRKFRICVKSP